MTRTSLSKPGTFISYSKPVISSALGVRLNGTGTTCVMTAKATFWNQNFGSAANGITGVKVRRKVKSSSSWSSYVSLTSSQYSVSGSTVTISNLGLTSSTLSVDLGTEYTFEVVVLDKLDTSNAIQFNVNSGTVLLSAVKGKGVCFGGLYNSTTGGPLQVAGNKVLGFVTEGTWT